MVSATLQPPSAAVLLDEAELRPLVERITTGEDPEWLLTASPMLDRRLARLPLSTPDDVRAAVSLARGAQRAWAQVPVGQRAAIISAFHDLVVAGLEELLDLVQLETGKARWHAFEEVAAVLNAARYYARTAARHLAPTTGHGMLPLVSRYTRHRRPWGVVGLITPWNYPLTLALGDAIPALLAGNAVVLRPDLQTTLTALSAVRLLDRAGLPKGLLQVVVGRGADVGQAVVEHADYVAFTGSSETGRKVGRLAADRLIGSSLELGGKNSVYIRGDADVDAAVEVTVRSCFNSAGQLCVHAERVLVHAGIAERFVPALVRAVERMAVGNALAYGMDMGSLAGPQQLARVSDHVADALAHGATLLTGGRQRPDLGPYVFEPTLLTGVTAAMACRDAETFGPVAAVYTVADDDAALRAANDTDFGLHGTIYTADLAAAQRLAAGWQAGTISVNESYQASWGAIAASMGGMKASGTGRRHGPEGIARFTQTQSVTVHRGLGFAVPAGLDQERYAGMLLRGLRLLKRLGAA